MKNQTIIFKVVLLVSMLEWIILANIIRNKDPQVNTTQGTVRGSLSNDGQYAMFMGIPFATVNPDNPFGDALPGPSFNGVFEASDDSAICPQREEFNNTLTGSLDCLHVNVYVPTKANTDNPLPVMVWIYGGRWRVGFTGQYVYGPQYIVRHDVILVTLNYRVGVYGFMCLDIPSVPGNAGLKDQRAGLQWVKKNIAAFGGDFNSITAFGDSSGAMSLDLHILSPGSNGLFHRAILQSGTALVEELTVHSRPSAPIEIAQYLGFNAQSLAEALDVIKDVPTNSLVGAGLDLGIMFKPCVERPFPGVDRFIQNYPDIILESGKFQSVPLLVGFNSHELLVKYIPEIKNSNFFDQIQNLFAERVNAAFAIPNQNQAEIAANIVKQYYLGAKDINREAVFELSEFDSDMHFLHPINRRIIYHLIKSNKNLYKYLFAYSGELNFVKHRYNFTEGGAAHADDIGYLFKQIYLPDENKPADQLVIDRMTTMWTNYAKYGNPTPETSDLLPVRWPPMSRALREYLYIDSELEVKQKAVHDSMAFWDLFYIAYGEYAAMAWSWFILDTNMPSRRFPGEMHNRAPYNTITASFFHFL